MSNDNTPLKIEKNIPLTNKRGIRGRITEALKVMKVGDSFLYPKSRQGSLHTAARNQGTKIATRSISETEVRVWRIA